MWVLKVSLSSVQITPTLASAPFPSSDLPDSQDLPGSTSTVLASPPDETDIPESTPSARHQVSSSLSVTASQLDRLAENPNAEPASKFQLKFKTALSSKGRPRKRAKQMSSFNKTGLDRRESSKKPRRKKVAQVAQVLREKENVIHEPLVPPQAHTSQREPLVLPQPLDLRSNQIDPTQFDVDFQNRSFLAQLRDDDINVDTELPTTAFVRTITSHF